MEPKPFTGMVPIVSGEVAEDLANYLVDSEQVRAISSGHMGAPFREHIRAGLEPPPFWEHIRAGLEPPPFWDLSSCIIHSCMHQSKLDDYWIFIDHPMLYFYILSYP